MNGLVFTRSGTPEPPFGRQYRPVGVCRPGAPNGPLWFSSSTANAEVMQFPGL